MNNNHQEDLFSKYIILRNFPRRSISNKYGLSGIVKDHLSRLIGNEFVKVSAFNEGDDIMKILEKKYRTLENKVQLLNTIVEEKDAQLDIIKSYFSQSQRYGISWKSIEDAKSAIIQKRKITDIDALPSYLEVKESEINNSEYSYVGEGLFTKKKIKRGDVIGIPKGNVYLHESESIGLLSENDSDIKDTSYTVQLSESIPYGESGGSYIIYYQVDTKSHWTGKMNHKWDMQEHIFSISDTKKFKKFFSNIKFEDGKFVALRNIEEGEELTWDYTISYWSEHIKEDDIRTKPLWNLSGIKSVEYMTIKNFMRTEFEMSNIIGAVIKIPGTNLFESMEDKINNLTTIVPDAPKFSNEGWNPVDLVEKFFLLSDFRDKVQTVKYLQNKCLQIATSGVNFISVMESMAKQDYEPLSETKRILSESAGIRYNMDDGFEEDDAKQGQEFNFFPDLSQNRANPENLKKYLSILNLSDTDSKKLADILNFDSVITAISEGIKSTNNEKEIKKFFEYVNSLSDVNLIIKNGDIIKVNKEETRDVEVYTKRRKNKESELNFSDEKTTTAQNFKKMIEKVIKVVISNNDLAIIARSNIEFKFICQKKTSFATGLKIERLNGWHEDFWFDDDNDRIWSIDHRRESKDGKSTLTWMKRRKELYEKYEEEDRDVILGKELNGEDKDVFTKFCRRELKAIQSLESEFDILWYKAVSLYIEYISDPITKIKKGEELHKLFPFNYVKIQDSQIEKQKAPKKKDKKPGYKVTEVFIGANKKDDRQTDSEYVYLKDHPNATFYFMEKRYNYFKSLSMMIDKKLDILKAFFQRLCKAYLGNVMTTFESDTVVLWIPEEEEEGSGASKPNVNSEEEKKKKNDNSLGFGLEDEDINLIDASEDSSQYISNYIDNYDINTFESTLKAIILDEWINILGKKYLNITEGLTNEEQEVTFLVQYPFSFSKIGSGLSTGDISSQNLIALFLRMYNRLTMCYIILYIPNETSVYKSNTLAMVNKVKKFLRDIIVDNTVEKSESIATNPTTQAITQFVALSLLYTTLYVLFNKKSTIEQSAFFQQIYYTSKNALNYSINVYEKFFDYNYDFLKKYINNEHDFSDYQTIAREHQKEFTSNKKWLHSLLDLGGYFLGSFITEKDNINTLSSLITDKQDIVYLGKKVVRITSEGKVIREFTDEQIEELIKLNGAIERFIGLMIKNNLKLSKFLDYLKDINNQKAYDYVINLKKKNQP